MDPLTAALILANTIAELIIVVIESQPPEVRAEFARLQLEDFKKWRDFIDRFKIPALKLPPDQAAPTTAAPPETPQQFINHFDKDRDVAPPRKK